VLEVAVPEAAVLVPEAALVLAAAVPEAAVLVLAGAVPVLEVPVPGVAVLVLVALEPEVAVQAPELVAVVRAPEVVAQAAEEPVRAEPGRVAPPAQARPVWVAARVEQLRPASAPLAPARRVRSVPLPVLPASVFPPAVARPVRRGMAPPRGRLARTEVLGVGRGAASWRPLLSRSPAPTSWMPCISAAINSRAPRNALRRRTARNCRSTFATDVA
jgi:hypothetical protein